jgi:hypothetical protein
MITHISRKLFFIAGLLVGTTPALADLQVFPTRLTIESRARTGVFNLRHIGNKTTRYRISPVFYKMGDDGSLQKVEKPTLADKYAGDMVIYSPRMISLEPGKEQVVRIQVRRPVDLQEGEYRMHLQFETFDDVDAQEVGSGSDAEKGVNMSLKAHRAIAVPILVQQGQVNAALEMKNPAVNANSQLTMTLEKTGNRSAYGDLTVEYKAGTEWQPLSELRGVAVYNDKRSISIPLANIPAAKAALLRISFKEQFPRGIQTSTEITNAK